MGTVHRPFPRSRQSLLDTIGRGSTDYVVAVDGGLQGNRLVEVRAKFRAESFKVAGRKCVEFQSLLECKANGVSDNFVSLTEGNSLVGEIGCGGHCVEISRLGGEFHGIQTEFERGRKGGQHTENPRNGIGSIEDRLLAFLNIFVIGERQSLDRIVREGNRSSGEAAAFPAKQFGEVGILLLWHGAGSGGETLRAAQ